MFDNVIIPTRFDCEQCAKKIHIYDVYIQYEGSYYHKDCFSCHSCSKPFSSEEFNNQGDCHEKVNQLELNALPCKNSANKLYCMEDFIRHNFKCKLCAQHFTENSSIYQLNGLRTETEALVHVECVTCKQCHLDINPQAEYMVDETPNGGCSIYCKPCSFNIDKSEKSKTKKLKAGNKHRLSSRQKEILRTKFSVNNLKADEVLDTRNSVILERLAKDMNCSIKSVSQYIVRHKNKLHELTKKAAMYKTAADFQIEFMLNELKKIDATVAPNQSLPGGQVKTAKSSSYFSVLLSEEASSPAPNICPFECSRSIDSSS